jgi:DNA polymerase III sliding clamp (beta) subunit (PCNA family)
MKTSFELTGQEVKGLVSKSEKIFSGKNTTIPVLSSIYFKMKDNKLSATTFDTKSGYVYTFPQSFDSLDMDMVVPLKEFSSLVKNISNTEMVSFTKEEGCVRIKNNLIDFKLSLLNEKDYPEIDLNIDGDGNSIDLTQEEFTHCFSLSYCMSKEIMRQVMASFMVKNDKEKVFFCSTDGHCMAYGEKKFSSEEVVGDTSACIPRSFVEFMLKFVKETEQDKIKLMFRKDNVSVRIDSLVVFSRLVDGEPIDPEPILSQSNDFKYTGVFSKEKLLEALKVFSDANKNDSPVIVKADKSNLLLSIKGDSFSGNINVEGESVFNLTTEPIIFGINADYAFNAVDHIQQDDICVSLIDSMSAVFFYGKNDKDRHVVMPISI